MKLQSTTGAALLKASRIYTSGVTRRTTAVLVAGWLEREARALVSRVRAAALQDNRKWGIGNPDKGLQQVHIHACWGGRTLGWGRRRLPSGLIYDGKSQCVVINDSPQVCRMVTARDPQIPRLMWP